MGGFQLLRAERPQDARERRAGRRSVWEGVVVDFAQLGVRKLEVRNGYELVSNFLRV